MISKQRYIDMKNKYVYLFIAICILIIIPLPFVYKLISPADKVNTYLENGNAHQAIEYYNENNFSEENKGKVDIIIENYINDLKTGFENNTITAEDCIELLNIIKEINNNAITQKAIEAILNIETEDAGNAALSMATEYFNEKNYKEALKTIKGISKNYSGYDKLKGIYEKSRDEVKKQTDTPATVEDYIESIEILDECIEGSDDEVLIEEKEQLTEEFEEQKEVYETIVEASESFEEKSFKDTFDAIDNKIKKYPDNKNLKKAEAFFKNAYIMKVSEEIITYSENEDYVNAQQTINNAINNYKCPEFQDILEQINAENINLDQISNIISGSKESVYQTAMEYLPENTEMQISKTEMMEAINQLQFQENIDISVIIAQIKKEANIIIRKN